MPTFYFSKKRFVISILCALFIVVAAGWVFTDYLVEMATRTVKQDVEDANLIISLNLTNELKKIERAASAVAGSPLTLPVLQANTPANMEKINNILDRYHKSLDAAACYLIDHDGLTLASSNRNAKDSFVGQNYTFRPYFQQAIKGGVGRDFAVGTVTGRRGFFASAPVRDKEGQVVGVVVIKKELDDIEMILKQYIWFLVDQNGIIFLSSQPEARLKSLWPLGSDRKQKIILSKQFGPGPFEPILQKQLKAGAEVTFKEEQYLTSQVATPYEGVSVILLWPTGQISMYRSFGIVLTLLTILLSQSFLVVIYVFTQSNFRMKRLLEESQSQAMALADSESQLRAQTDELEAQKEALLEQRRELEESKETLAQIEERNRLILSSVSEGIFGLDTGGTVTFVNSAASNILGFTEKELLGKLMHAEVHYANPDGSEFSRLQCPMYLSSQDGKPRTVDSEVLWRKDGTPIPVEYSTTPICKDGQVAGTVVSFHDTTERRAMEEAIRKERERLQDIMDSSPIAVAISTEGKLRFGNPALFKTFDIKIGEPAEKIFWNPEDRKPLIERMQQEGIVRNHDIRMRHVDGYPIDIMFTILPTTYDGKAGALGWLVDISSLKQTEKELKERMEDLERFSRLTINREEKMIQLKEEINILLEQTGKERKYRIVT
ncbi:MAG: PAS domain S-box protein [Syntrophales bacterium]|nr:PAS domain S-box protein [Syntrophales bacterium]